MSKSLRKLYELSGLDSESFSIKIENEIGKLPYVKSVLVNSLTSRAIVEHDSEIHKEKVFKDICAIINTLNIDIILKEIERNDDIDEHPLDSNEAITQEEIHVSENQYLKANHKNKFAKLKVFIFFVGLVIAFMGTLINNAIGTVLLIITYLIVSSDVLLKTIKNTIKRKFFNEEFLIAFVSIALLLVGRFSEAVLVILFYEGVTFLKELILNKSKKQINELMNIKQDSVSIRGINGEIVFVKVEEIKTNDIVIVRPGEKIPVDGIVYKGTSLIDNSIINDEVNIIKVKERDEVISGTTNQTELIEIRATKKFKQSTAYKIIDIIENVTFNNTFTEEFITKFIKVFILIIIFSAILLGILAPILTEGSINQWTYRALIFLSLSFPWALIVSIPLIFTGGIETTFKNGIIIKSRNYLESIKKTNTVVFDKAGTLTDGYYHVRKIVPKGYIAEDMLLEYAAYAELYSNHPIAKSIIKAFKELSSSKVIDKSRIKSFEEIPGKGVKIYFGDRYIYAGNHKLMEEYDISYEKPSEVGTIIYIAINQNFVGYLVISDKIKETSPKAIDDLKKVGIKRIIMITGDNKKTSDYVGEILKIDEVYSELSIQEKVALMENLENGKADRGEIVFVSDGIVSDLSVEKNYTAVGLDGFKSDLAKDTYDILIMTDNPLKIATAIKISKKVQNIASQNIILAIAMKIMILTFVALGLASMWMAVLVEIIVTVISIFNSFRVKKFKE
ncbi:heavy metal translocating P-type ATPase [Clostridium tunisiense]|uniref:heavy metal translocating P-type ATPase n=1 Tax=Clostridium tunisiense TaxID=219748 RepID=UPI0002E527B9|nr:heavy metal translocating P-type ATPase [Clostridium tunisiense]